eukprot:4217738-Amphidinium_carterae.1
MDTNDSASDVDDVHEQKQRDGKTAFSFVLAVVLIHSLGENHSSDVRESNSRFTCVHKLDKTYGNLMRLTKISKRVDEMTVVLESTLMLLIKSSKLFHQNQEE